MKYADDGDVDDSRPDAENISSNADYWERHAAAAAAAEAAATAAAAAMAAAAKAKAAKAAKAAKVAAAAAAVAAAAAASAAAAAAAVAAAEALPDNCATCRFCLDKPMFGGENRLHRPCELRQEQKRRQEA